MRASFRAAALGFGIVLSVAPASRADTVPDFFVGADACRKLSRECTCADAPLLELLLKDKERALDAWDETADAIDAEGSAIKTNADARNDFVSRFQGDSRIGAQFLACPSYSDISEKMGRSPSRVAGVSLFGGGGALDPCYCEQFCLDAVDATIAHENDHFLFAFEVIMEGLTANSACLVGQLDQSYCDSLGAHQQARTEQSAHVISINHLSDALTRLRSADPEHPDMECTWEPLPDMDPAPAPDMPEHASLWQRVELLVTRFVRGQAELG
jgi:hypothetical protein